MKIVGLDIGDAWTGVAISDALEIIARPLTTVAASDLESYLQTLITQEKLQIIVVGNPITLKGKISQQTEKVHTITNQLKEHFPEVQWILWDERLSSKQAATIPTRPPRNPEEKKRIHARAAALILSTYLEYRRNYPNKVSKEA